jgi:hypothetical protein
MLNRALDRDAKSHHSSYNGLAPEQEQRPGGNMLIGQALDRKQVSKHYATEQYPHFMKTQAPFSLYNQWRDQRQQKCEVIAENATKIAKKRFQQEL